jgi:hypothetical protein
MVSGKERRKHLFLKKAAKTFANLDVRCGSTNAKFTRVSLFFLSKKNGFLPIIHRTDARA